VEPDGAPTLAYARAAGAPVDAPAGSIAVDALAPRRVGELVFPITQAYVADVATSKRGPAVRREVLRRLPTGSPKPTMCSRLILLTNPLRIRGTRSMRASSRS